jgi:hypothetical protein
VAGIFDGTSFNKLLLHYEAEISASWEHRSGQPGVQLWSVQPDEDQLQREAPKCPGAGANSRLISRAFCVSDNHAFLTGRIKLVRYIFSLFFGSGFNWVSGSGCRQVEIGLQKRKNKENFLF